MAMFKIIVEEKRTWRFKIEANDYDEAFEIACDRAGAEPPDDSEFEEVDSEEVRS